MLRLLATATSSSDAVGTLVGKLANGWDSSTARTSLAHLCGMAASVAARVKQRYQLVQCHGVGRQYGT